MGARLDSFKDKWRGIKDSAGFHNFLLYLAFVAVASLFWLILSLNDSVTRTLDIRIKIDNVPDTVIFINDPPAVLHVTLRDKGTNIIRNGVVKRPQILINFRDFSDRGLFRFTPTDLSAALKSSLGGSAQILTQSLDSLSLVYTSNKGRRVPISVCADLKTAPGSVLVDAPEPKERTVMVYSTSNVIDTITKIYTEKISMRNLSETTELTVKLQPIAQTKIIPSTVKVKIPVEPLVKKESIVTVNADNVPEGESLLLFPMRIQVTYYVPMSLFNSDLVPIDVSVDYADLKRTASDRIPVRIKSKEDYVESPILGADSVEYTLVRGR